MQDPESVLGAIAVGRTRRFGFELPSVAGEPGAERRGLLFPCAQRRGAVEVTCLERGRLLPLHLAELLGGIRKAGGDGQADQPRLRICLLVPAGQQSQHPFPDLGIAGARPAST